MEDTPGLHWIDWIVFGAMVVASLVIGIYLHFVFFPSIDVCKSKNHTPESIHVQSNSAYRLPKSPFLREKFQRNHFLLIGLYHSGRQRSTSEYLMGNHDIQVIPAAMSLTVSFISSILILGEPAEMYTFGGQLWISKFGWLLGAALSTVIFVPVLHPLKLTSVNEVKQLKSIFVLAKPMFEIPPLIGKGFHYIFHYFFSTLN